MKDKLISVAFFVLLLGIGLLLFAPKEEFSVTEKRYLEPRPELNWETLLSGEFAENAEDYAADHVPFRNFLVGLDAQVRQLLGMQAAGDIYVGKSGRLYEVPAKNDMHAISAAMDSLNEFSQTVGKSIRLMIIPSSGYILRSDMPSGTDPYEDDKLISEIYSLCGELVQPVDLLEAFSSCSRPESLYYSTDHHWTSAGAYKAYALFASTAGRKVIGADSFSVSREGGFYGATYSRSALWRTQPDEMELWDSGGQFTVTNSERADAHEGLFYSERLSEPDKYPVFLDGNHALVHIVNRDADSSGSLLVIRDSFSNCLGCFLAQSYREVTMVDLRYYKRPVSELAAEENFDDILAVYGINNFVTDSNLGFLE